MSDRHPESAAPGEALRQIPLDEPRRETAPAAAPRRLRAGLLLRIGCAAALIAAAALFWTQLPAAGKGYLTLKRLEMKGDTEKVPLARLREAVEPLLEGRTYFSADLDAVRAAAETVPWVKYAVVRRVWPDRLVIEVTVYEAVAQFEDGRLVSVEGRLFAANPDEGEEASHLPSLSGTADEVPELLRRYRRFSNMMRDLGVFVSDVTLSDRGSWSLTFQSPTIPPTKVELGRESSGAPVEERLRQVVAAYPKMAELLGGPPSSIDARYRRAIAAGKVDRTALAAYLAEVARAAEDERTEDAAEGGETAETADDAEDAAADAAEKAGTADAFPAPTAEAAPASAAAAGAAPQADTPDTPQTTPSRQ